MALGEKYCSGLKEVWGLSLRYTKWRSWAVALPIVIIMTKVRMKVLMVYALAANFGTFASLD